MKEKKNLKTDYLAHLIIGTIKLLTYCGFALYFIIIQNLLSFIILSIFYSTLSLIDIDINTTLLNIRKK